MSKIIRLKEVLEQMETATEPFSIRYVKCNRRKGTGGQIVELPRCFKTSSTPKKAAKGKAQANQEQPSGSSKMPNHYENYTRNLKVVPAGSNTPNGQIRKCSIWLIIQFNGMKVII